MPTRFARFIKHHTHSENHLPLTHTTSLYNFRSIIKSNAESKMLETSKCDVFENEKLLYLFYGRPAYKKKSTGLTVSSGDPRLPVCFLLKPDLKKQYKRIFPFDSGHFKDSETLHKHMDEHMDIMDFYLGSDLEVARNFVATFFNSNFDYYRGRVRTDLSFEDNMEFEVKAYYNAIGEKVKKKEDHRLQTLEVSLEEHLLIGPGNIDAVVLPSDELRGDVEKMIIDNWKATPLPYYPIDNTDPTDYRHTIITTALYHLFPEKNIYRHQNLRRDFT